MPTTDADSYRLEPRPVDATLAEGVRAAVADPAWMLARQLQFGELAGEDAGSPAGATLWLERGRLTRFLPRPPDGTPGAPLDITGAPLEAHIENEWQPREEPSARFAALAGLQYLRLLPSGAERPTIAAYRAGLARRYPLVAPRDGYDERDPMLALAIGRALDGQALYRELAAALRAPFPRLPRVPSVDAADVGAVTAAARAFMSWYDALTGRELADSAAWVPNRLEYQVSIAGPTNRGELVLAATEYDSGTLDWFSFDVARGATLGAGADPLQGAQATASTFLPSPVSFRGMPAARFWQIEDEDVDLAAIEAGPEDVAAMLVVEFALRYGNDFFLVPLPLDAGAICRVGALVVADTFGQRVLVSAATDLDADFRVFEHSVAPDAARERALVAFPIAVTTIESAPVEDVGLLRDEGANVCWAVERTALGPTGLQVDRSEEWSRRQPPARDPEPAPADGNPRTLRYALRNTVPDNWYPLLPAADREAALRFAPLRALPGQPPARAPLGRFLGELAAALTAQEEVTRAGRRLVRTWQYTRGIDGRSHTWVGRRATTARLSATPGLRFDEAQ
jgi:hypothetical protein